MLTGSKEPGKSHNESLNPDSKSTLKKSDFVTRKPISIFRLIKKTKNEEEKKKLNQLLETLRKKLPEGFKIGAAVGEGDCFFDSIAQGLNELKDKGLITGSKGFSVKSLRENCKQYAQQVNQSKKGSWLNSALKGEGEKLCEYIPRIEFTAEDIENTSSGSEIKILKLKNAIWGRPEVEGKMICEKYSIKIRIIELRDGDRWITYIENPTYKQSGCSRSPGRENRATGVSSRKRGRSVTDKDGIVLKELRIHLQDINKEIKFVKSVAGKEGTPAFSQFLVFLVEEKRLEVLKRNKIKPGNMSSILNRARANAKDAFEKLYDLWFDEQGNKKQCLKTLEKNKVNIIRMSSILSKAGAKAATAFKDLYDLWFTEEGNETRYLKALKKEEIDLVRVSSILHGAGAKAATAFKDLYDLWFDEQGNKKQCLKTLEKNKVDLLRISSILGGAGAKAATAFKDLYDQWFDEQGNKKQCLKTLEKNKVDLVHISSILSGAGSSASKAFIELYDAFFDKQGNKTRHLKHFVIDKDGEGFTLCNLSSMLGRTRANAKDVFEELHSVCFNNEGKKTKLLNDFYKAGFKASNLSCMLCGSRARASSILKRLHSVCFDDEGERTELLDDFYRADFDPYDLCNILSRAPDSIKEFHDFCFTKKTKKYLSRFLDKKGFTVNNLCNILHGAENKVCSALKDFSDVCFDDAGNRTHLLDDFYNIGFMPNDLSCILSMAGNNAASILRGFHKSCFNKENYLNHFLAERTLFTPKDLSKILIGVGTKICSVFERLHDLCFDKAGNKTKYLNDLIKDNPSNKIIDILYHKVRKCPSFLKDDIQPQQLDISIIEESEMKDIDSPSTPLSNEVEHTNLNSNNLPIRNSKKRNLGNAQQQGRSGKKQKVSLQQSNSTSQGMSSSQYRHNLKKKRRIQIYSMLDEEQQEMFLRSSEFISRNLKTSAKIYERIAQGRQISEREEREVFAFSKLLDDFDQQLDSSTNSLPSSLIHTKDYKMPSDLSNYIAGIEDNFAIHLVTSNHVVAVYRVGDNYAYFDSNVAFVSGLKSADQLMEVVEKGVKFASYKVRREGFLVEHFDVDLKNSKNAEEIVQATKFIPFIGSKREVEKAEQTRKPLLEQLVKGTINCILAAVSLTNASWSKSQLSGETDDKPRACLNDPTVDNQLQRSL
ncbi:uncharacterized protein TNIN_400281 [Trichonephila inaurata madagascariensis]|uniref:OTU domain-containing protein n=1 Tax=Trichonephila inaurata madagascariensis TaxID=2747483 RepID=A0A8X7BSE1_9ARAC|nr:uncharacterized protein TNIN_400281 [Trichonephila inaurata madagascariensis]